MGGSKGGPTGASAPVTPSLDFSVASLQKDTSMIMQCIYFTSVAAKTGLLPGPKLTGMGFLSVM